MAAQCVSSLLAVTLAVSSAFADPPASGDAKVDDKSADKASALALARAGDEAYKAGDFERAAELVRRAYELYPEPLLLYNLALALDGMGKPSEALDYYERYLATNPDVKDRGAIERRVATMRSQLAAQAERAEAERVAASKPRPSGPTVAPAPASKLPFLTIGVGVLAAGGGIAFGAASIKRHDDAEAAPSQLVAQQHQDRAQLYATTANVLFIAGGVIAVGGVVWAVLDRRPRSATETKIVIGRSSIGVAWTFR